MRRREPRRSAAFACAVTLHGLLGAYLLQSAAPASGPGTLGGVAGPGMSVSLLPATTEVASPSLHDAPRAPTQESPSTDQEPPRPVESTPAPSPEPALAPEASAPLASSDPTGSAPSSAGSEGAAGGGANAMGVLAEVARCLPAGMRPQLSLATLTLSADQEGKLIAAPVVVFPSASISKEDAQTADLIVQAALQCGPYRDLQLKGRSVAVPADFTAQQGSAASEAGSQIAISPKVSPRDQSPGAFARVR